MKVSARWLRDLVPGLRLDARAIADVLALRGAPVEEILAPGEGLGDVVVGRVVAAKRHPNADRLSLCTVEAGAAEPARVVCGAPNVEVGAYYPFAPVGAVLPGGVTIRKAKIRGEVSEGMLCSAKELGLGTDHSGILRLDGDLRPGQSLVEALGLDDATLDVEVTANRGDLLSHVGIARELLTHGEGTLRLPEIPGDPAVRLEYVEGAPEVSAGAVSVRIQDPDLCGRYMGAVIRGVRVAPSPPWLQARLRGAGARPINNVVDATNYVMLELGHPLHAFDLRRLHGSAVVVRRAGADERRFTTLDGVERTLSPDMLMICDAERPVGVAGVMGGLESEVEDDTTDVLLECALFEPKSIRATRKALGLSTDASYRFERGVDPEGARLALERAVALILATAGGRVDGPVLDCHPVRFEPEVVTLRLARVERLLGVPFAAATVRALLEPLGFALVDENADSLRFRVPGHRSRDVRREADLIEEIARTHGYDAFPSELRPYPPGTVPDHPLFRLEDELRHALVARGLFEALTPGFAPEGEGDVEVSNPLSAAERFMRGSVLPSLLRRVEHNLARGNRDVRLFEIATAFRRAEKGAPPVEETRLAAALCGRARPPHWSRPDEPLAIWDVASIAEEAARRAYRGRASLRPAVDGACGAFDPTLCYEVTDEAGHVVGRAGRVAESAVDVPVWAGDVWGFEITLPAVPEPAPVVAFEPLPPYPPVERDLALLVPHGVAAGAVASALRAAGGALLESLELFDVYEGEGLPAGTRSLAFRLRFRSRERTLKDPEVERAVSQILERLEEELGVRPRA